MNTNEREKIFDSAKHSVPAQRHGVVMQGAEIGLNSDHPNMVFALKDLGDALNNVDFPTQLLAELDELHFNKMTLTHNGRQTSRAELGFSRIETRLIEGEIFLVREQFEVIERELVAEPAS